MTFTDKQQKDHRDAFIKECRQKAWGAACHSDWISKSIDELMASYTKMQEEDKALEVEYKTLENAVDHHSVENRNKRKTINDRRYKLAEQMKFVAESAQKGTQAMNNLLQSVESALQLATHAEAWSWKEVETKTDDATQAA
jgi:hypothetical protein